MGRKLAGILVSHSVGPLGTPPAHCSRCRRTPLVGELLHVLASGKRVCELCVARLRSRDGEPVAAERVRNGERPLAVVQRAA